jgi:intracellular septation protein A
VSSSVQSPQEHFYFIVNYDNQYKVYSWFGLLELGVFGTLDVSFRSTNSCIKLKTAVLAMLIAVFSKVSAGPWRSLAG